MIIRTTILVLVLGAASSASAAVEPELPSLDAPDTPDTPGALDAQGTAAEGREDTEASSLDEPASQEPEVTEGPDDAAESESPASAGDLEARAPDIAAAPDVSRSAFDDPASTSAPGTGARGTAGEEGGAVASGSVRSDDDQFDERVDPADGGRRHRRRRRGDRSVEGWQMFAPYPDLGTIRYRDPEERRTLWLGADVSGTWLPASLGLASQRVWVARPAGAWAVAVTPWMAVGGRHSLAWFDAQDSRIRVHGHQVELSARPLAGSRSDVALDDRLSVGVSVHALRSSTTGERVVEPGGLDDTIVHAGYGLDHRLGTRWRLGWQAQVRYVWVHEDTQRHARVSTRLAFHPRPAHRISADAVGFYVNRDPEPRGTPQPRHSIYGQFGLAYAWVANAGIGPWLGMRYNTGFMSGEAPVYELRDQSPPGDYGEVLVGMLARWQ